ncbi:hypothetical protein ABDZ57_04920 [Aeromonas veronii]|uniref:hypothetical protein n=1 Tax=Aeromonas veronii TaxID=654 RepID=UPI0031FC1C14
MPKTIDKAKRVVDFISNGGTVCEIKDVEAIDDSAWHRISSKAYDLHLIDSRKKRAEDEKKENVSCTSNDEIKEILLLSSELADYALSLPSVSTMNDFKTLQKLMLKMPLNEHKVIDIIERITMSPKIRALQKKGRFEHFSVFKEFSTIIDAAVISYYRKNYISSYLTLVPVIEGILLRWLGYSGVGKKPEFEDLRNFFSNSHVRQPCPGNALFYDIYIKACDKLLKEHLYKPSDKGSAYSNFNRHLAAHLLSDSEFATQDNCVRLFNMIDVMTEIFYYETHCNDPRFSLKRGEISLELENYEKLISQSYNPQLRTPEQVLLVP